MSQQEITASLDHFIGQRVTGILTTGDSPNSDWSIQLESGIVIGNKDEEAESAPPEEIVGKVLCLVTFGELDTKLQFGLTTPDGVVEEEWVTLKPLLYTIGGIEGQTEEYYPQAGPTIPDALPEDPSGDRVADGPEPQEDEE